MVDLASSRLPHLHDSDARHDFIYPRHKPVQAKFAASLAPAIESMIAFMCLMGR